MSSPVYAVLYFDIHGRAEPIRLLLASLGLPFEDRFVPRDRWMELKPTLPLGQVPVLYVRDAEGGERAIPQSQAILRHLGRAHDRYGEGEAGHLACDVLAEAIYDLRAPLAPLVGPATRGKDPAALRTCIDEKLPPQLARLETLHRAGPGGFFVGPAPTWADCLAFDALDKLSDIAPAALAPYPGLTRFLAAFREWPGVAERLAARRPSELAPLRQVYETGVAL